MKRQLRLRMQQKRQHIFSKAVAAAHFKLQGSTRRPDPRSLIHSLAPTAASSNSSAAAFDEVTEQLHQQAIVRASYSYDTAALSFKGDSAHLTASLPRPVSLAARDIQIAAAAAASTPSLCSARASVLRRPSSISISSPPASNACNSDPSVGKISTHAKSFGEEDVLSNPSMVAEMAQALLLPLPSSFLEQPPDPDPSVVINFWLWD